MPRALPLPHLPPSDRVGDLLRAIAALTDALPDNQDAALQHVSDCRHVMIAAGAAWETTLAHTRELYRSPGARGVGRSIEHPTGGIKALAPLLGMALGALQDRVNERHQAGERKVERARRERYPDSP